MPYEIPQNLKYSEKIIFNLDMIQLFWISLFGIGSIIVYMRGPFTEEVNIILSGFLLLLAFGFAFLDIFSHLKAVANYAKSIHKAGYLNKDLKKFLEVEKVEDDTIYLGNGNLRALIEVLPINFSILSIEQQKAIIHGYREFLNSLDFGIQIIMRTVRLDVNNYMSKLDGKIRKEGRTKTMKEFHSFRSFVDSTVKENDIKDRLFYVVVPFDFDENPLDNMKSFFLGLLSGNSKGSASKSNAHAQLNVRVKVCEDKLKRCGLKTRKLCSEEITSILAMFFESKCEKNCNYLSSIVESDSQHALNYEIGERWIDAAGKQIVKQVADR